MVINSNNQQLNGKMSSAAAMTNGIMSTNNSNGIQQNGVHQQQQQDFDLIVFGSIVQDLVTITI
jgi:hypothetical protein